MYKIVVYYFEFNEKIQDFIQREEATFDANLYWHENGHFRFRLTSGNLLILPQNRYVQIIEIEEDEKKND